MIKLPGRMLRPLAVLLPLLASWLATPEPGYAVGCAEGNAGGSFLVQYVGRDEVHLLYGFHWDSGATCTARLYRDGAVIQTWTAQAPSTQRLEDTGLSGGIHSYSLSIVDSSSGAAAWSSTTSPTYVGSVSGTLAVNRTWTGNYSVGSGLTIASGVTLTVGQPNTATQVYLHGNILVESGATLLLGAQAGQTGVTVMEPSPEIDVKGTLEVLETTLSGLPERQLVIASAPRNFGSDASFDTSRLSIKKSVMELVPVQVWAQNSFTFQENSGNSAVGLHAWRLPSSLSVFKNNLPNASVELIEIPYTAVSASLNTLKAFSIGVCGGFDCADSLRPKGALDIQLNTFHGDVRLDGIGLAAGGTASPMQFENNAGDFALYLSLADQTGTTVNRFVRNNTGLRYLHLYGGNYVLIEGNHMTAQTPASMENFGHGVTIARGSLNTVRGNEIALAPGVSRTDTGIRLGRATAQDTVAQNEVTENTVRGSDGTGIWIDGADLNTVKQNLLYRNRENIRVVGPSSGNTIVDNIFVSRSSGSPSDNAYVGTDCGGNPCGNTWNVAKADDYNVLGVRVLGGNYWGGTDLGATIYRGQDADGDGLGDSPMVLDGPQNTDSLPLVPALTINDAGD